MRKLAVVISVAAGLLALGACQKAEEPKPEAKAPVQQGPIIDSPASVPGHGPAVTKPELKVVVPDETKNAWKAVVMIVEDKKENKKTEYTVNLGDELKIPDSSLTVKIGPFLPHFMMSAEVITTASNNTENPAVGIAVLDDGKQVYPDKKKWGWLYSKFPNIHSFMHERYGLTLKEGVKN